MALANKSLENFVFNQKVKFIYTHEFTCQFFDHAIKGAFLWENPDQDFWPVAFLSSKSIFWSVIYQIHSGQVFIVLLVCVI